jgi:hypothetical protein
MPDGSRRRHRHAVRRVVRTFGIQPLWSAMSVHWGVKADMSVDMPLLPKMALFGHAAAFAECPLLRDERTKLRRGPRSEFGRVEMWRGGFR